MNEKEEGHYEKAIGFYESAKEALQERKAYPSIWDAIQSQLAATYLIVGLRMSTGVTAMEVDQAKVASEYLQVPHISSLSPVIYSAIYRKH